MTVDHERRVRLVAAEDLVDRVAHRAHLGRVEIALRKPRRVAGGEQQVVAVAERHLQLLGEVQHHLGARSRPAGLDEAQVPRRDA